MSTRNLLTRLDKLEMASFGGLTDDPFNIDRMTTDEQYIVLLLLSRSAVDDPKTTSEERQRCVDDIQRIETAIREMARREKSPEDARHFEECRGWWKKHGHTEEYVPALMMWHFNFDCTLDWDKPDLMRRRLALRAMPEVQALRVSVN